MNTEEKEDEYRRIKQELEDPYILGKSRDEVSSLVEKGRVLATDNGDIGIGWFFQSKLADFDDDYEQSKKCLENAIEAGESSFLRRCLGKTFSKLNQEEEAIIQYDKSLVLDPNHYLTYQYKGVSLFILGQFAAAIDEFDKALALESTDYQNYRYKGVSLSKLGNEQAAIEQYDKAIALFPNHYLCYLDKGKSLTVLGKQKDAIEQFDKAIALNPKDFDSYRQKSVSFLQQNLMEAALDAINQALAVNPNDSQSYRQKGVLLSRLEKNEAAIAEFNKAIEINPNYSFCYHDKGVSLSALNREEAAIVEYTKALDLRPDGYETVISKGSSLSKLGRETEAIVEFDKAIAIDPEYFLGYRCKSICLGNLGYNLDSMIEYEKAVALNSDRLSLAQKMPVTATPFPKVPGCPRNNFEKTVFELPKNQRCIQRDPGTWNLNLKHCYFGVPSEPFFGWVELTRLPDEITGFHFYLGASQINLMGAFVESIYPKSIERLSVGNSSYDLGEGYDYSKLVDILSKAYFPKLKSLHLGVWELFCNAHCAYGKLGNISKLLSGMPNLDELCLYGNFELTESIELERLEYLEVQLDDSITGINGGRISNKTLNYLLSSEFPSLTEQFIDLDIDDNTYEYRLPDTFLKGENVPKLSKIEIVGKFVEGEKERILNSPLAKEREIILHLNEIY